MAYDYLVPSIVAFPSAVQCHLPIPWDQIGSQLADGTGAVIVRFFAIGEGEVFEEREREVSFAKGTVLGETPAPDVFEPFSRNPMDAPGFIECSVRTVDGQPSFAAKSPLNFYSIYAAPRQKSYFSDNAWKYASPLVVRQIAEYGQFADGYPAVRIDRDRDLSMSVILINPYMKDIVCRVFSHDDRTPLRSKVPAMSARRVELQDFLKDGERRWHGQIQLTANNRLVTYILWHSMRDPAVVSDLEHLDAYRGEETHIPATLQLRRKLGAFVGHNRGPR